MLVADAVIGVANRIYVDFAVFVGQWDQFAARVLFRSAAFVGIDVGVIAAQHRLKGLGESLQAQNIRARSVEGEENCDVFPEMLFKLFYRGMSVEIGAVSDYMSLIRAGYRGEYFRVHAGVVIAGEAARRLNRLSSHKATIAE